MPGLWIKGFLIYPSWQGLPLFLPSLVISNQAYIGTASPLLLMPGNHQLHRLKHLCGLCLSLSFHKNGPPCRELFEHKLQNLSRKVGAITSHRYTEIKPSVSKLHRRYQLGKNVPTLHDSRAARNLRKHPVQPPVPQMRRNWARETCSQT